MAMNCAEFLKLMDEDGAVNAGEAKAHVESCASCRDAFHRWQAIRGELKSMKEEPAPPFLHSRVMIHVRTAAPDRAARWGFFTWSRVPWAGPLLAAALLILLGGYGLLVVLEPAKQAEEQKQAQRAQEIGKLKKDLPPMTGSSKTTVERQYDEILSKAEADRKAEADKTKHALTKEEAPLQFSGLKKDAEEAARLQEKAPAEEYKTRGLPPAPRYAPEPAPPPPASQPARSAAAAPAVKPAPAAPAPAGNLAAAGPGPTETRPAPESAAASRDQRLRRESAGKGLAIEKAALVACVLESAGGGSRFYVALLPSAAPAEGSSWSLLVHDDGSVSRSDRQEVPSALSETLAALHLPPGRYTLRRTP